MKKKLLFLLILVMSASLMFSCKFGGDKNEGDGGSNDNTPNETVSGTIFSPDIDVTMIVDPSLDFEYIETIMNAIESLTGRLPSLEGVNSEKTENLIIIGPVDRDLADEAYSRIERYHPEVAEDDYEDYPRYLIYSASSSVVIAYEEDEYDLALDASIKYFISTYLTQPTLTLKEGVHHRNYCDIMAHVKKLDEERQEKKWQELYDAVLVKTASLGDVESKKITDDLSSAIRTQYNSRFMNAMFTTVMALVPDSELPVFLRVPSL